MPAILLALRRIALWGTLSIDALLVLFPRTFYERIALGDQYPSGRQFIFRMREKYTADFSHMVGDIILASVLGLFIVFTLYALIRKTSPGQGVRRRPAVLLPSFGPDGGMR
jgi:hypothetical protein